VDRRGPSPFGSTRKTLPDRYDPGSLARRQLRSWRRHSRVQVARPHHERSG
jgi:hypothetical protein